jgi:hypothetical protein
MSLNTIFKNGIVVLIVLIGIAPSIFEGNKELVNWWLFVDYETTRYWSAHFYSETINFALLAFLLMYPKGVNRTLLRIFLVLTVVDVFHLIAFRKLEFVMLKHIISVFICIGWESYNKLKNNG